MSFKAPNSPPLAPTLIHLSYHKIGVFLYAHRGQPCVAAWPGSPPVARAGSLTEGETNTVKSEESNNRAPYNQRCTVSYPLAYLSVY